MAPSRTISTRHGPVIGTTVAIHGGRLVEKFLGIPYACPPTGPRRFTKPEPPEPWTTPLEVTKFSPKGSQGPSPFSSADVEINEHNLYLNVFAPSWKASSAVLFFIHGGGFLFGDATRFGDDGICHHLVGKDVVVVIIQYRLGYFGFFSTGDSAAPGNYALWDQTAALRWVQENIAAFGGDKDNVTIFGQSAGGASVDLLTLSPHSNGLFHKACPMAGSANTYWASNPLTLQNCQNRAKKLGIDSSDSVKLVDALRKVPAEHLYAELDHNIEEARLIQRLRPFILQFCSLTLFVLEVAAVVDGDFLPESIEKLREKAPRKPTLTGITRLEGLLFVSSVKSPSRETVASIVDKLLEIIPQKENASREDLISRYLGAADEKRGSTKEVQALAEVIGDMVFNIPTQRMISDLISKEESVPAYSYIFDFLNPAVTGLDGQPLPVKATTHGNELPYLFGKTIYGSPFQFGSDDQKMLELMTTIFTNFAKFGNPSGASGQSDLPVEWDPVTSENPQKNYVIDLQPRMEETLLGGRPALY